MYDVDLLRKIYEYIAVQTEEAKANALCDLAHAVLWEDEEEIRLRLEFLEEKYGLIVSS